MRSAIAAATDDPRFPPITLDELDSVRVEINALSPPSPIRAEDVEVGRHGLIIRNGRATGLLLPQVAVEQGWNRDEYLTWLCRKAGLPPQAWLLANSELEGFEAEVWSEP